MGRNIKTNSQIHSEKSILRNRILEKRDLLHFDDKQKYSNIITNTLLLQESYRKATSVLVFLSYASEVDTSLLIKQILKTGKKVYAPRIIDFDKGQMDFFQIYDNSEFEISKYNIKEPFLSSNKYSGADNTLCITPGIVFDKNKNRIGYGKGFYDRFFERYVCDKIGICFDLQIVENVPTTIYDRKLDMIISERRIL